MRKIVLSAIAAILATVGVYHLAFLMCASKSVALATALATIAFIAIAIAATFTTPAAIVVALATALATSAGLLAFTFAFAAIVAILTTLGTFVAAEQEHLRFKWVAPAYVVEALTICGALMVGSIGWSVAIALGGIAALLTLWRLAPRQAAVTTASALPDGKGA